MTFGEPQHIADLQRASVVDLLRLLDYPNGTGPGLCEDDSDLSAGGESRRQEGQALAPRNYWNP